MGKDEPNNQRTIGKVSTGWEFLRKKGERRHHSPRGIEFCGRANAACLFTLVLAHFEPSSCVEHPHIVFLLSPISRSNSAKQLEIL